MNDRYVHTRFPRVSKSKIPNTATQCPENCPHNEENHLCANPRENRRIPSAKCYGMKPKELIAKFGV